MRSLKKSLPAVLAILVVTACGASPTGLSSPTATAQASVAPSVTAAATAMPTTAPTATVAATSGALDLCSLLTADDVTTVLGGGWAPGVMANDYCHWDSAFNPNARVVTFVQAGTIDDIRGQTPGGTSVSAAGHDAYSVRDLAANVQTTYIDIGGGQLLIVEIPNSSDASADLESVAELIAIAIANL